MNWLEQFKSIVDQNPDISDEKLFRAFPELEYSEERMDAALMYWKYQIVAPELKAKKLSIWKRMIKFLWQK